MRQQFPQQPHPQPQSPHPQTQPLHPQAQPPHPQAQHPHPLQQPQLTTNGSSGGRVGSIRRTTRVKSQVNVPEWSSKGSKLRQGLTGRRSRTRLAETEWIEQTFQRRECIKFVPDETEFYKCVCGKTRPEHTTVPAEVIRVIFPTEKWSVRGNTTTFPTDAYGTIEFQGAAHPTKAHYLRLATDTKPDKALSLLLNQWGVDPPKLLISVHGGIANFELQPKLRRVCQQGLLKAAKTTGAWIVTGGTNTGVMKLVGDALGDSLLQSRDNIVTLGVAPWGVIHNRHELVGRDTITPYHAAASASMKSQSVLLNCNHTYFLLVDDGTTGKFGSETIFRRKLEKHISQQKIQMRTEGEGYKTPVVVLLVEGGSNTIRTVLECVTDHPPVPVVVVDGSGRAADLIAFTHQYAFEGKMLESLRDQLLLKIERTFNCTTNMAEKIFVELMLCVKRKELITIHKVGEEMHDIDQAILAALLKGQNQSASDQLSLALTWNRVDIARSHIFTFGQDWQEGSLDQAMMDAIINDQVEFVKLLIENGVKMYEWLTIDRLEELYNLALCDKKSPSKGLFASTTPDLDRSSTLKHLMKEQCNKTVSANIRCTLPDIGQIVNKLMSGAYRSSYSRKKFRLLYDAVKNSGHSISNVVGVIPTISQVGLFNGFKYPYSDLMVWAVLLRRHRMARFFWESGEEALAKALIACKLNKSLAEEAEEDELEIDVANEIRKYSKEFAGLANELLDHCYKTNDDLAQLLLTYELSNWSDQTCLSLAVSANQKTFIANTCTQILLTEMWLGGLRNRNYSNIKVIAGIVFFPSIFFMEYRSWEELQMLPQTLEEHIHDLKESGESDSDDDVVSTDSLPTSPATTTPRHSKQIVIENVQATGSILESSEAEEMEKVVQSSISIQAFKTEKKHRQLRLRKKIYEFYSAPITKFWMHAISYGIFLVLFIYLMLVQLPDTPNWIEGYISMCMIGTAVEKIREFSISEPRKPKRKLKVFFTDLWNIFDFVTLVLFFIGFIMRFETHLIDSARVFYSLTVALCILRVMTFLAISSTLGPFVQIFGRMMIDLGVICVFLLILLVAFGTFRLSIWFPNSPFQWHSVREIFLKPYFMLYGEEFADIIWPDCSDTDPTNEFKCTAGRWLVPVGQSLYILVGMYLLICLLMAKFNNTFNRIYTESNKVWKFQRYILVIEYQSRPILPAPLILLAHLVQLLKYILRKCSNQQKHYDTGLKLFLCDDDVERLHDFEEECMQIFCMERENKICSTTDERIKSMMTQIENINIRIDDVYQREAYRQVCLQRLDAQLSKLCELAERTAHSASDRARELAARTAQTQFVCDRPSGARSRETPTTSFDTKQKPTSSDDRLTLGSSGGLRSYNEKKLGPFTAYSRTSSVASMDRLDGQVNKDADGGMEASAAPAHEPESVPRSSCLKLKDNFVDFKMLSSSNVVDFKMSSSSNDDSSFKSKFPSNNIELDYMTSAKDTIFAENAASMSEYELPILQPIMFSAPERMEYSSIVNDIDTSCVDFQPSSPSTPHHSRLFNSDKHGRYRRRLPKRKSRGTLTSSNDRLRRAEDTVHQKLEGIVHQRIRKISLTETESFSDLAKSALESLEDNEEDEEDGNGMCNSLAEDTDLETSSSGSDNSKPETVPQHPTVINLCEESPTTNI